MKEDKKIKTDALGNPIVIGQRYGYTQNANGVTRVRIGRVIRETEYNVTMAVEESKRALYDNILSNEHIAKDKKISIKSVMLIPIYDE